MENKDQNNAVPLWQSLDASASSLSSDDGGVVQAPLDPNALSYAPEESEPLNSQEQQRRVNPFLRFVRRADVILVALLLIGAIAFLFTSTRNQSDNNTSLTADDKFGAVQIPLGELTTGKNLSLSGAANVTINGPIQLNDGLNVTPTLQPTGAKAGQIYYDKDSNQLAYYNGSQFVFLTSSQSGGVQSLGGATGQISLGSGLSLANGQLSATSATGVLSVQGQNGNVTFAAGPGIVINGTNFSNSGVLSIAAGSPNVHVNSDGAGNVSLSVDAPVAGTGTVTSGTGGTVGHLPLFTASQNIEDSIVTQSGLTVTISGDLSVVTGGLTLSNSLTVSNGGTGTNSLAANGVLVGHGTAAVTSVAAGSAGLCLVSTNGVPVWAACPSGNGVNSLNGLTGGLSIANASGAGTTITIDDASTSNKGIASFNGTNFSVSGGNVNTIQNINSGATPTFAGVNTNNITPNAALTVGVSAQTALLQGSTTTITSNGAGNSIVLNSAGTIELQDDTNVTGNVTTTGSLSVNGGNINSTGALNINPSGTLTVGSTTQTLTLQGGATSTFRATSGANATVVAFSSPTANTTLNFPALTAGTYTICTSSGNCSGAGVTLQAAYSNSTNPEITLDATRGALSIRDNSTPIGANLLEVQNNAGSATYLAVTASGVAVTGTASVSGNINSTSGTLQTNGTNRIDNAGNGVNLGNITLSGAISGGTTITGSGNINTTGGAIQTNGTNRIDNSGNLVNIAAIAASGSATFQGGSATLGTNSQAGTIILNDGSSNTGTLAVAALGQNTIYTLPDPGAGTATICLSSGNCAGVGGGVTTTGGTTNQLPKFTGSNSLGDSSISDDATNVTVSVDVIIQGGDLTVGSASQQASIVLHDGNGQTTTLQAGDSTGNLNFILPTTAGNANQCLKQSGTGNQLVWQDCDGGSGGSSATLQTAYNNSTNPEIVLNSSNTGLTIRDNSTPIGSNLFEIQNNAGSTTYLAVTVSGVSVTGTATASGNVNTTGGALQTNSTNRIDNSGNLVNIGNITGTGAVTVTSIGAGNDITIDGADQFIVQDASVFNALSTFNANIDLGANDIVGTTGNINLTNFDVVGSTGAVTAGTYNGQTISNTANFTGTVAVAGNTTLTGDLAVNGGDITSTGALNITPNGTLTVGVTGQQLILQGSANTSLTANSGGFATTLGFNGVPAGNVTYNLDRSVAAGTYTICTTVGNCSGSGGVTTTGGTTGTIAVFTGAQTLGDSLLSQSGSTVTVNGNLNLVSGNEFQVNGTQISSANLSNDANLAKLSASQTFTGNSITFKNATDSINAFNIQNNAGNHILSVDSSSAYLVLGDANSLDGALVFENVSNAFRTTIVTGTPTANRTITLPDASGVVCTDSGNCAGAGATLQTAYNFSVGGTTPKIKLDSTLLGFDIQDADTTIGANLFNVRASNAAGLGSVLFGVGSTGTVTVQNSSNSATAFNILTSGGTRVLTGDTQNGRIVFGQASTLSGTIVFQDAGSANTVTITPASLTGDQTITLPNATGTICLSSGNCSGSGSSNTLQAAYDAGNTITGSNSRDLLITMADTATDPNFLVNLQCDTSCGGNGRFAIQDDGVDTFTVSPSGTIAIQPTVASTSALNLKTILGNNLFTVDTQNSRIGFNLGSNNVPVLAGTEPGIELHNGVLRLSGTSGMDSYTSPAGASVATKISVETHNLPNFGQIMALGVGSTSDVTSRVISLFDARTVRHQPTLAVFSPDENNSVGFSWNGSNATASIQTSDNTSSTKNLIVQSGNVSSSGGNSGDLQLNTGSVGGTGFATGNIYLVSGDGTGTNNSSGNVSVDVGVNTGSGTRGTLNIGVTNALTLLLGRSAGTTTLQGGTTNVSGTLAANGNVSLGDAAADLVTVAGTIQGGSPLVFEGATADANELTLSIAALSADRTITLPNEDGTVCLQNSASCGFVTGTTASFIQNQNSAQQVSSNFWISGTGRADTALQAPSIDTATSAALSIGTANASSVTIGSTTNNTPVTINSGTGTISIGTGSNNRTVNVGTGNANQAVTVGSTSGTSSLVLQGGTNGVKITTAGTTSAYLVQDTAGQALFNIDAVNGWTVNNGIIHPNNLLENPSFEANGAFTASGWNFSSQGAINTVGAAHHGNKEFTYTPNGTLLILSSFKYLEAQPGDTFYGEAWYKAGASTNGTASFSFTYYDKDKVSIGSSSATNFSNAQTTYALATVTGTAPAGTAYVRLTTGVNATSTTGSWTFDDYTLVRTNQQAPFSFKNTVNSTTAMQVQSSTGGVVLDVDTTNGRVGIGTNAPSAQLDVAGQIPTAAAASVSASNLVYSVAANGKYAYSANFAALQTWDITRPTAPVALGTTATTNNGVSYLKVYGKYAFDMVTTWDSLDIFDLSVPNAPTKIKNLTITSMQDIVVSGRYMYVGTGNSNKDLLVYDIINPANPVLVATLPQATYSLSDLQIQGRYMYASAYNGISPRLVILDLANPTAPTVVGSVAASGTGSIDVSGRYVYLATSATLQAFNVANPAAPVSVGTLTIGGSANNITVQDRYAYVSIGTSGIAVANISNPASMSLTGTIATGTEIRGIYVQGRYVYASDYGNSRLNTYDIGGTYTQALEVGTVAAANVDVSDGLKVTGDVQFSNGFRSDSNSAINGNLAVNGTQAIAVNSTATTGLPLLLQQSGTGDTGLELKNSVSSYYVGVDTSDSNKFKISSSTAGSSTVMGYNTIGATTDTNDSNTMNATKFTAGANGTISNLYVRIGAVVGTSPNNQGQMALYSDSAGSPGTLLASSPSAALTANSWNSFTISPTTVVSGTVYWIVYNTNGTAADQNDYVYDAGSTNQSKFVARTFGTWPSSWTGGTFSNGQASLYGVINTSSSTDNLGSSLFSLTNGGQATFQNNSDMTSAFRILNAAGTSTVLNADTMNGRVGIGNDAPTRTLDVSVSTTSTNSLPLLLQQAGTGDVGLELKSTSKNYYVGVDNTDGAFKIASGTSANGSFNVGNTTVEPNTDFNTNGAQAYKVTASGSGTVSSISVYIDSLDVTPANRSIQVGLYSDNGSGTSPNSRLGMSSTQTAVVGWNTIPLSGVSVTSGTVYWIAMAENGANRFRVQSSAGGANLTAYRTTTGYTLPNPFAANSSNSTDRPSFYMTVANAGGSDNFNGTNLLSMSDFGATTFRNSSNSAAAFRVLNASGISQFAVDTNSSAVYIGAPGSGTTSLTVSGTTTMQGSASVTGNLNAGTLDGAGLTDCDGTNSKLLWDATTKLFSCGTDKPNVLTRKASAQTSASTTYVSDPVFTFTIAAGETWAYQINTGFNTNDTTTANASDSNPEIRMNLSSTTSVTCSNSWNNLYNVQNYTSSVCTDSAEIDHAGDTNDQEYLMWGTFVNGGASSTTVTMQFRRSSGGTGTVTHLAGGFMTAYKMTGADLAEAYYTKDASVAPGTIVSIDDSLNAGVKKSQGAYDSQAIGVVSTAPGQVLGDPTRSAAAGERPVLLALNGRIPVRVSLENGPIKAGDYLTTSSTPGVAMKATHAGQMIGKALEGFNSENASAEGSVMAFANLTYADPTTGTTANNSVQGSTTMANLNVSDTISTKDLKVTGTADINKLIVGSMTADEVTTKGNANFGGDINLEGVGLSRNAITKKFVATHPIAIGAVVIADPDHDGQITTTTTAADTRVLGVALTAADAGDEVTVAIGGSVQVKTADDAIIKGGDLVGSSTVEGAADKLLLPTPGSLIGKALSKPVDGMTWILISLQ